MIFLKSGQEINSLREANRILAKILERIGKAAAETPGITTKELDKLAERLILERGAKPAFKGYRGFPCSLCASINEEVVHGIPDFCKLQSGNIVSLDLGLKLNGYYGDAAITVPVGKVSKEMRKLVEVTKNSLYEGIKQARPGNRLSDISYSIQSYVEKNGFSVVRDFTGHGIGRNLHEEPSIPNFGPPHRGIRLQKGMVFAIEPMVNMGGFEVETLENKWTVVTRDRKPSAHFEHTIAVTDKEPEILSMIRRDSEDEKQ
ncbi:MAG: type I methionyl aminopeptidase [Candidatus Aerophobetes bacterium]|nr:type I methionyl aminopeptidase [Candidatus Aerophobetes bacterium]